MLTIPKQYLTPLIAVLALIGVYSVVSNPHDLYMIIALGVFGWTLRRLDFSLAPVMLQHCRRSLLGVLSCLDDAPTSL
jgi:putative tricarboxylic transport membrane protein